MTYQEKRLQRRADRKTKLLTAILHAEHAGEIANLEDLAVEFGCAYSSLYSLRCELAREGLINDPETQRLEQQAMPDLEARIEAVRAAKMAKLPHRRPRLTQRQLERILP